MTPAGLSAIVDRNIALGAFDGAALAVLRGDEPVVQLHDGFPEDLAHRLRAQGVMKICDYEELGSG